MCIGVKVTCVISLEFGCSDTCLHSPKFIDEAYICTWGGDGK